MNLRQSGLPTGTNSKELLFRLYLLETEPHSMKNDRASPRESRLQFVEIQAESSMLGFSAQQTECGNPRNTLDPTRKRPRLLVESPGKRSISLQQLAIVSRCTLQRDEYISTSCNSFGHSLSRERA